MPNPGEAPDKSPDFHIQELMPAFTLPTWLPQSAWHEHVPFAMYIIGRARPRLFVELGTHHGLSYCAFCESALAVDLDAQFYAIDTWEGDDQTGEYGDEIFNPLRDYHDRRYSSFSTLLRKTFEESITFFEDGTIDLIHIDGYHSYDSVRSDFDMWLPKMSERGIMMFHDLAVRRDDFGVWKFWEEVTAQYPGFHFNHGHGLGVLYVGSGNPDDVLPLFNASEGDKAAVRKFFSYTGKRWQTERQKEEAFKVLGDQNYTISQLKQLQRQAEEHGNPAELRSIIVEQNQRIDRLREQNDRTRQLTEIAESNRDLIYEQIRLHTESSRHIMGQIGLANRELDVSQAKLTILLESRQRSLAARLMRLSPLRRIQEQRSLRVIKESPLFDGEWYLDRYTDVSAAGLDPAWHYLRYGAAEKRDPGPDFDTEWYLFSNPDVGALAINPLVHYIKYGQFEGRSAEPPAGVTNYGEAAASAVPTAQAERPLDFNVAQTGAAVSENALRVLYVISKDRSLANNHRYRVFNIRDQLIAAGDICEVIYDVDAAERLEDALTFDVIVFFRIPKIPQVGELVARARQKRIPLVYDTDDYTFDVGIVPYVDAIKDVEQHLIDSYIFGVERYREFMLQADYFIGSTATLTEAATDLGVPGHILPNGLNDDQVRIANDGFKIRDKLQQKDHPIRIGYLPGTNTHRKDFAVALPAIIRLMDEFPELVLSIRGQLELPEELEPYSSRVETAPFVHWSELIVETAHLDINIAPLEHDNPFTDAKSALKYFESALVEVPTVATPTADFVVAIKDGETGFLAMTEDDWYSKLKRLIEDKTFRHAMGTAARIDALRRYTIAAQSQHTRDTFRKIVARHRKLDIVFMMWHPQAGSGGARNILRKAHWLNMMGHRVRVYIDDNRFEDDRALARFINESFVKTEVEFYVGSDRLSNCEVLLPTFWLTAEMANKVKGKAQHIFYFVQDYEPFFYDDDLIGRTRAARTYTYGFNHITLGKWLTKTLRQRYGAKADYFQFPIAHEVYYPPENTDPQARKKQVLFLARPEMPRRRYPLGIEALKMVADKFPDVEFILYGSVGIESSSIPFGHTNLKVVNDVTDLANMYREARVGVVFSTTNPSLVPLELMACGCPVVELDNDINRTQYDGEYGVTLAEENPAAVAEAVIRLLTDADYFQQKVTECLDFASRLPSIEEATERVEELIIRGIMDDDGLPTSPAEYVPTYTMNRPPRSRMKYPPLGQQSANGHASALPARDAVKTGQ
ncbi:MAG: glycosyltransferase [Chloroflexota bacterium]